MTGHSEIDPARGKTVILRIADHSSFGTRMEAYEQSTTPLIEFHKSLGLLLPVAARGSPEELCDRTLAALNSWCEQRLPAARNEDVGPLFDKAPGGSKPDTAAAPGDDGDFPLSCGHDLILLLPIRSSGTR